MLITSPKGQTSADIPESELQQLQSQSKDKEVALNDLIPQEYIDKKKP